MAKYDQRSESEGVAEGKTKAAKQSFVLIAFELYGSLDGREMGRFDSREAAEAAGRELERNPGCPVRAYRVETVG